MPGLIVMVFVGCSFLYLGIRMAFQKEAPCEDCTEDECVKCISTTYRKNLV